MSGSSAVLLPYAPASVAAARWRLSADLRHAGVFPAAVGDAALVVSELMSNALRHARPLPGSLVEVTWALNGGSLEITVSDGGSATRPRPASPSLSSLGGRGLAIVEYLSCRWGVSTEDTGTTVWAVLPAPRHGPDGGRPAAGDRAVVSGRAQR
ncbi:MAG: ATP-binding protein [Gemmatimonadota bacterium]